MLVGFATYLSPGTRWHEGETIHRVEIFVGVFVGAVTFTGSIVAFGKLQGRSAASRCCCRAGTVEPALVVLAVVVGSFLFVVHHDPTLRLLAAHRHDGDRVPRSAFTW